MTVAGKGKAAPAVEETESTVELPSLPRQEPNRVAMPTLNADGSPMDPDDVVLVEDDDPRSVHFEG